MTNETKQTAVDTLINNFKESITFLESSLNCCNDELTKVLFKARLSQARYFLNYAIESKEMEKKIMIDFTKNYNIHNFNYCNMIVEEFYDFTYGGNK